MMAQQIVEIPNLWTLLGLIAVLVTQVLTARWQSRAHVHNTGELDGIRAELAECRARWDHVQTELVRMQDIVSLLARGIGQPPPPRQP